MKLNLESSECVFTFKSNASHQHEYIIVVGESNLLFYLTINRRNDETFLTADTDYKDTDYKMDYLNNINTRYNLNCDFCNLGSTSIVNLFLYKRNYNIKSIWIE